MIDNLQMNVAYKSISTGGATGQQLKMTNWFAVSVPRSLAPHMDAVRIVQQPCGVFRSTHCVVCTVVITSW